MKKQLIIPTFFLIICLICFGQTKTENKNQEKHTDINKMDTSIIAVLPFDTTQHWMFKNSKPADLTTDDLQRIETILTKSIDDYNSEQEKQVKGINDKHPEYKLNKKNFILDLTHYKRQYIAVINPKGEKEVWINCFCDTHNLNWRTESIVVKDGGNCYFNLKINLTTERYYELMVNGSA